MVVMQLGLMLLPFSFLAVLPQLLPWTPVRQRRVRRRRRRKKEEGRRAKERMRAVSQR